MASKTNIRSIRFSDDIAALIEEQTGDTFTQKFENLVIRCVQELPEKEQQLQRLEDLISLKRRDYQMLRKQCIDYSYMLDSIGEKLVQIQKQLDELVVLQERPTA